MFAVQVMQNCAAVFRTESSLKEGVTLIDEVASKMQHLKIKDKSLVRTPNDHDCAGLRVCGSTGVYALYLR